MNKTKLYPKLDNGSAKVAYLNTKGDSLKTDTKGDSIKTVRRAEPDRFLPFEYSNKLDNSRGVHCSNVVLKNDSCSAKSDYEWSRSSNDDDNEHIPSYIIHNLNRKSFKEGKIRINDSADAEGEVDLQDQGLRERTLLISVLREKQISLPNSTYVANCHILINEERAKNFILPLIRETELDEVASDHAKQMMNRKKCEHSDIDKLILKMSDLSPPWQRIGENVCRGKSVQAIHKEILESPDCIADKNNMYDRRFSSFGVGIANCSKGKVYICQIYRG